MRHKTDVSLEEKIAHLFQPDSLLLIQYTESFKRKTYLDPEKMLMLAVLEDGIACFQRHISARGRKGQTLFREAEEWIFPEVESDWIFAFDNVCETLGLDPGYLRGGLTKMRERKVNQPRKPKLRNSRDMKKRERERIVRAVA